MIRTLLCVAIALGASAGVLSAADAFTGSWKLDVAKSTFASDEPVPKEVTLTFTEEGGNRTQVMTRTAVTPTGPRSARNFEESSRHRRMVRGLTRVIT